MQLYEQKFEEALSYLSRPDILNPTGDRPICYVNYDVEDAMEVYRMIPIHLIPNAKFHGFADVKVLSIGNVLQEYIHSHEYYEEIWIDEANEFDLYESIRQEIQDNSVVANAILHAQQEMMSTTHPLLILKDLELLHPYDKIGRVEQLIYKKIEIPILILYPGNTLGSARIFLNIYPMDGSYRSKNF